MSVNRSGLSGLNEAQSEAVRHLHGPLLILAGAGTGKTRVITTRIAWMIAEGVPPSQILAVTFTNKAANEMRERAGGLISKKQARAVTVSTFHSLCVRILRSDIDRLGFKKTFGIYAGGDQLGLIRKIVTRKGGKNAGIEPKVVLGLIGDAKNKGLGPDSIGDVFVRESYQAYQDELKLLNAVDFDDLLILAVELLEQNPGLCDQWQRRFPFIMVDEFQDTNSLQMRLLRALTGPEQNVCVVGDDDQSIYGWRGADITNILEFERFFPDPKVVKLEENYRCTMPILHTANSIIRHNKGRREKTLWSKKESDDKIRVIAMPDADEEAKAVVEEILSQGKMEKRPWEDFSILFRMNAQSRPFEMALRENEIPYRVVGGMSFFDRREVRDLLAYLMVLINPTDDLNLLRILNNPPRGIGATAIQAASDFSAEHQISIWDALQRLEFLVDRRAATQNAITEFTTLMKRFAEIAHTKSADYATMATHLIEEIEFGDYLRRNSKTAEEAGMRELNVRELIDTLHQHRAKNPGEGLQHFLDEMALSSDRDDDEDITKKKGVCLITLHAAKGLEFPVVYLVGLEEGILPHTRSIDEGSRDEERRLLYVGITRAKDCLTMTWCAARSRYGERRPCQPSTFIRELDKTHLDEISFDELEEEPADTETTSAHFDKIREMLMSGGK
ncbi:MAG: DNA helicase-2/ATP-dependent DNA helicase PcrA [Verrucomicrobiales bacterium]|jgi:DNA helicase-2/ATP-dependent DNA helicase PcrA